MIRHTTRPSTRRSGPARLGPPAYPAPPAHPAQRSPPAHPAQRSLPAHPALRSHPSLRRALTLLAASLGTVVLLAACGGDGNGGRGKGLGNGADGGAGASSYRDPADGGLLLWTPVGVEAISSGCDEVGPGCAGASLRFPLIQGDDPLSEAARNWIEARILEPYLFEGSAAPLRTPEQVVREFIGAFDEIADEFPGEKLHGWTLEREADILAAHPPLVVLRAKEWTFTGGAHGNAWEVYENLDSRDGSSVTLERLVGEAGMEPLRLLAERRLRAQLELAPGTPLTEGGLFADELELVPNFRVEKAGVVLHYNPYAIGPWALGMVELLLPWEDVDSLLLPDARIFRPLT
jgi:hypothetical protein